MTTNWKCQVTETPSNDHGLEMPNNFLKYVMSNKNPEAQILSTLLLKQVSCNKNVSAIHVHVKKTKYAFAFVYAFVVVLLTAPWKSSNNIF